MAEGPELSTVSREFTAGTNLTRLHLVDVASKASWSRYPFIHAQLPQKRCGSWFVLSNERASQETLPRASEGTWTGSRFAAKSVPEDSPPEAARYGDNDLPAVRPWRGQA